MSGVPAGLLSRIGIDALEPRPTDTVSRPNEMRAGPPAATVTVRVFDVMAPLLAVMSDVPFETPVTTPLTESTVATAGLADVKTNEPPAIKRLFASLPRATRPTVPVTAIVAVRLLAGGLSVMDASTCDTVSSAPGVEVKPCAVARICVRPLAADVALVVSPAFEPSTATDPLVETQVNETPLITASSVSCATARYRRVKPSEVRVKVSVLKAPTVSTTTAIRVIGVITITSATPVIAPDVARICAVPSPKAVTLPPASTDATAGAVDVQVNVVTPVTGLPSPSTATAEKVKARVR